MKRLKNFITRKDSSQNLIKKKLKKKKSKLMNLKNIMSQIHNPSLFLDRQFKLSLGCQSQGNQNSEFLDLMKRSRKCSIILKPCFKINFKNLFVSLI